MFIIRKTYYIAELNVALLGSPFLPWKKRRQILETNVSRAGLSSTAFAANVHVQNNRLFGKHLVPESRSQFEAKDCLE